MKRLFIFDMDGTVLPETTACLEIAGATGTLGELVRMEADFKAGTLDAHGFASRAFGLWGHLEKERYREIFSSSGKIGNIRKTVEEIRKNGSLSCLITLSPDLFAEYFYEFGFDFVAASRFPVKGQDSVEEGAILEASRKPEIVQGFCERNGIGMENTVAFGDGISDLPLFEVAGCSVFVNADENIQGRADLHYEGSDLYEAYRMALEYIRLREETVR